MKKKLAALLCGVMCVVSVMPDLCVWEHFRAVRRMSWAI